MDQMARKLHEMDQEHQAKFLMNEANRLWNEMIDADPYYGKTALMISSELKDVESLKIFMEKGKENQIYFNMQDHKKRSAFIHACQETGDLETRKEAVEVFLQNAEELQIDLDLKDENGKTGFQYLPQNLITELQADFPQMFDNK